MEDPAQRALQARRESMYTEFRSAFEPTSAQDWCKLIKGVEKNPVYIHR